MQRRAGGRRGGPVGRQAREAGRRKELWSQQWHAVGSLNSAPHPVLPSLALATVTTAEGSTPGHILQD